MGRIRAIELPWTQQPQGAVPLSAWVRGHGGYLVVPSLGARELLSGAELSLVGTKPDLTPGDAGLGLHGASAASENGYRFGSTPEGGVAATAIYVVRGDAAPSTGGAFGGLGSDRIGITWDHTSVSFVGGVQVRIGGIWYQSTLGAMVGGRTYCLALRYDGAAIYAIRDGLVVSQAAAAGAIEVSDLRAWGVNTIAGQGHTAGLTIFGAYALNRALPLTEVLAATRSPAAFWTHVFAPIERRIWVPSAAASAVPNITAVSAENITGTSADYRVTLDYA